MESQHEFARAAGRADPLARLRPGRPAAVVLGDLTLLRPLGQESIAAVVATSDPRDVTLRSRYASASWRLPAHDAGSEAAEVESLATLGRRLADRLGRKVPLFYGSDWQLELLYRNRRRLGEAFLFLLNDDELGWALHDKGKFHLLCAKTGIRAPRVLSGADGELEHVLPGWTRPVLVKPRCKANWYALRRRGFRNGGKARVYPDGKALLADRELMGLRDQLLVQELIPGDVNDLCSFHGFAGERSQVLAWFCGRKLRTFPHFGGESALIELVKDADLARAGRDVVERLGIKGPFKIDFIRDPRNGALVTLEVNARFNLWHYLGAAHGVNLLHVAHEYLTAGRAPATPPDYTPRWRWLDGYRDYLAFRESRALVPGGIGSWMAPILTAPTLFDTFAWKDPVPYLHWLGQVLGARLRRR
jgi:predicted ATP-grasp superfamily ATP-dependent carboligase